MWQIQQTPVLFFGRQYFCQVLGPFHIVLRIISQSISFQKLSQHDIFIEDGFPLLFLVILGCDGMVRDEISNFLKDQGFQDLTETFVSEKNEVRQLNRLSYQNLID